METRVIAFAAVPERCCVVETRVTAFAPVPEWC
jgi:hypothetical protein